MQKTDKKIIISVTLVCLLLTVILNGGTYIVTGKIYTDYNEMFQDLTEMLSINGNSSESGMQRHDFPNYYKQVLDWGSCPDQVETAENGNPFGDAFPGFSPGLGMPDNIRPQSQFECAIIKAPLDWTNPSREIAPDFSVNVNPYDSDAQASVNLLLKRIKARSIDENAPTLLVNPGGSGGSGTNYLENAIDKFSDKLRYRYNITSWDPRGASEFFETKKTGTTAVKCYTNDVSRLENIYHEVSGDMPDNHVAIEQFIEKYTNGCKEYSGSLLKFIDTTSTVRDMELIRQLLGQEKLNYFGFSYGSSLGVQYARLFGEHVGKFALDGISNPDSTITETALSQARGFEDALTQFLTDCVDKQKDCPFVGETVDYAKSWILASMSKLHNNPIRTTSGDFNETVFVYSIFTALYVTSYWEYLRQGLSNLKKNSDTRILRILADSYFEYDPQSGRFLSNMIEANSAINCQDNTEEFDLEKSVEQVDEFKEATPTFYRAFTYPLVACKYFPKSKQRIDVDYSNEAETPLLLVATMHDPATPYSDAETVNKSVPNSILLGYDSNGHTAYSDGNSKIRDAVDNFLLSNGEPPKSGTIIPEK